MNVHHSLIEQSYLGVGRARDSAGHAQRILLVLEIHQQKCIFEHTLMVGQGSAVKGSTVQYSTAQYSTGQHSAVQYRAGQGRTVQGSAVQGSTGHCMAGPGRI